MRSPRSGVLLLPAAVLALLLGSAGTARAHPFGTPPVVKIEAAGAAVDATWSAQRDDIAVLKNESGGDETGYLRSHIVVRQDGRPCRVNRADGVKLHFRCSRPRRWWPEGRWRQRLPQATSSLRDLRGYP
ncbi:hypothetical protein ACFWMU_27630 [Streptomyces sp. NPDC058357]|uniref:hypothetical protein n=1 Tax=unclassified Streptomyces TaxID=2593676 RepID=UPI003664E24E